MGIGLGLGLGEGVIREGFVNGGGWVKMVFEKGWSG